MLNRSVCLKMCLILFCLSPSLTNVLHADDWTVGVGGNPSRNSFSHEEGPVIPSVAWQGSLNAVVSQQAVIEGNIAVMARIVDLDDVLHGTRIVAHDLIYGDTLWTTEIPVDFPSTDWRSRVSAIRDGRVYATRAGNTNASYLYALDAQSGSVLWRSEGLLTEATTEGATFAPDGDIISTGVSSVIRISSDDGTTVWESGRTCPTTGGCDAVVSAGRVYLWEAGGLGPVITAFDLETGDRLFSSKGIGGGYVQQVAPFSGPDGTIYAPRTQNNPITDYLVALKDTGSGFSEKWRVPLGYVPFASFGVAPDGSVYSYSRTNRVIRIEPSTGTILDSSEVIVSDFYQPRMAVDSHGFVFLTNGGFSQGALYAFIENLSPLWPAPEPIANVNVGGPALGQFGVLIVCGVGADVRAYKFAPDVVEEQPPAVKDLPLSPGLVQNYPNPFNGTTTITLRLNTPGFTNLVVFDALGREVVRLVSERLTPGIHQVSFDGSMLSSGTYFYRLSVGEFVETRKLTLLR